MSEIVVNPTSTAQWQALVNEAEAACDYHLGEELESYLVFVLMRFVGRPEMASKVLALDYLNGMVAAGRVRLDQLRDVGDQCLLFSGLFPKRAERRRVKISYYVGLGRSAYRQLSEVTAQGDMADFYHTLSDAFVRMMDVLQAMRAIGATQPGLDPIQALELWQETGSRQAYRTFQLATQGLPVFDENDNKH